MSLKNTFFVTLFLFTISTTISQRYYDEGHNRLGISGGLTLFNIDTPNFDIKQGNGFIGSFETRGAFYNAWDLIYGLNFTQNQVSISGKETVISSSQDIDYSLLGVQVKLLASYNIVPYHLSIEGGPLLNINGKMKLKSSTYDSYILDGYTTLRAQDIQDVSKVHFHLAAGISGGIEQFKVSAQYQYGVTNLFGKFNDNQGLENTTGEFKGNTGTLIFGAQFYF